MEIETKFLELYELNNPTDQPKITIQMGKLTSFRTNKDKNFLFKLISMQLIWADADELAKRADLLKEKCGVFGCLANGDYPTSLDVAHIICLGLVGLQHRGQEAAGIVTGTTAGQEYATYRGTGLVSQVFNEAAIKSLKGEQENVPTMNLCLNNDSTLV